MYNENNCKLIVIEGIDGSGKHTQSQMLVKFLEGRGKEIRTISFPDYNSPSSAPVKMYLKGEIGENRDVNVYAASSFYAADRYISYKTHWERDFKTKDFIVANRYTTSNIVHQMVRLPREEWTGYMDWLYDFEYLKMGLPKPDLVIYLDMPPEISQRLIEKRYNGDNSKKDILESDFEYMIKCRECAVFASEKLDWRRISCFEEDRPLKIEEIQDKIQREVINYFNL